MLVKLVLTKFKKHEDLTVNFVSGLNVIRGLNEAGKSSIYHAISYALYGSRGLPKPLDETVTYGYPVGQLKVELDFTHAGVAYKVTRSKSGAVITGGGSKTEGQEAVTLFISDLLGVKQDVASKIMIANQSALKNAVEGGSQAVSLIETLSGVEVIDNLIAKVQACLPCGHTAALEKQIADLNEMQSSQKPVANFSLYEAAVNDASHTLGQSSARVNLITSQIEDIPIKEARQTLLDAAATRGEAESLQRQKIAAETILASPEPLPVVDLSDEYSAAIEADRLESERCKAYTKFVEIQQTSESLGTRAEVSLHLQMLKTEQQKLSRLINNIDVQIASARATKITDTSCALCGKLLEDVPEVVAVNTRVEEKVAQLIQSQEHPKSKLEQVNADIIKYETAMQTDRQLYIAFSSLDKYLAIYDTIPVQARWLGDVPERGGVNADWRALMTQNKAERTQYLKAVAARDEAVKVVASCDSALKQLVIKDDKAAKAQVADWEDLQGQLQAANTVYSKDREAFLQAEARLASEKQLYASAVSRYEVIVEQLKNSRDLLKEYRDNNDLILRLRQARPIVAQQLWNIVLSSTSHYFSRIRGVPSIVTKSDKGFAVDSKNYEHLSGSTIDSLGLAVRMSLQKTFLPNVDFMLLDEPASGCDDNRECAMLGILASSGYSQVVLVTHSPLADSFAAQVVTI